MHNCTNYRFSHEHVAFIDNYYRAAWSEFSSSFPAPAVHEAWLFLLFLSAARMTAHGGAIVIVGHIEKREALKQHFVALTHPISLHDRQGPLKQPLGLGIAAYCTGRYQNSTNVGPDYMVGA